MSDPSHASVSEGAAPRSTRSRRIRAVLAGGLVLGIGGAVTLASWSDSEFASGVFTSGQFNLQGSTTSATEGYTDHASETEAAELSFTTPVDNLSPGDVVYAPLWVRLDAGTTSPATLDLVALTSEDQSGSNSEQLSYDVYAIAPDATCDESATSGTVLGSGETLAANPDVAGGTVQLPIGSSASEPGEASQLCFVITASADLAQGGQTTATWQFTATSE